MFNLKNNYKYDNKFNVISLLVLFLTFFISVFAIYNTHFKTVFILNPIIVGYLIYLRYFKFNFRIL